MLKRILCVILMISCFAPSLFAEQLMQDVVYLKDGSIIRGQIIEQIPDVSIKIETVIGNIFAYKMEEVEKIVREPFKGLEIEAEKSPAVAFVLSFILPGLGQYYNGEPKKGITQEALVLGGSVLAVVSVENVGGAYRSTTWSYIGFGIAGGACIWSLIDAPLSAGRINKERRKQRWGHLIEFNKEKYVVGLDLTPMNSGMGAKLSLHF